MADFEKALALNKRPRPGQWGEDLASTPLQAEGMILHRMGKVHKECGEANKSIAVLSGASLIVCLFVRLIVCLIACMYVCLPVWLSVVWLTVCLLIICVCLLFSVHNGFVL